MKYQKEKCRNCKKMSNEMNRNKKNKNKQNIKE